MKMLSVFHSSVILLTIDSLSSVIYVLSAIALCYWCMNDEMNFTVTVYVAKYLQL